MPSAMRVLIAAKAAFFSATNDQEYAKRKSNTFLNRCGARFEDGPEQEIPMETVNDIVYAMLDEDTEQEFYRVLGRSKNA